MGSVQTQQDHTKCELSSAPDIRSAGLGLRHVSVHVSVVCLNLRTEPHVRRDWTECLGLDLTGAANASSLRAMEAAFHLLLAAALGTLCLGLQYYPQPRPEASRPVVCSAREGRECKQLDP